MQHPAADRAHVWTAAFREAFLLSILAILVTALTWTLRPDALPWSAEAEVYELELPAPLLSVDQALVLYDEGNHLFVDTHVESAEETKAGEAFVFTGFDE